MSRANKKTIVVNATINENDLFKENDTNSESLFSEDDQESSVIENIESSSDQDSNHSVSDHDSEENEEDEDDDDLVVTEVFEAVIPEIPEEKDEQQHTFPFLFTYERAKILGIRVQQLMNRAAPMIDPTGYKTMHEIAAAELEQRVIPFFIKRPLPNGKYDLVSVKDLIITRK